MRPPALTVTEKLAGNFRRLSTGLRISTAADDAAGLAISERLRSQIRKLGREGYQVSWNDWDRYGDFQTLYAETMHAVDATGRYFFDGDYFDALKAALGERVHLALVLAIDAELLVLAMDKH